MEDIEFDNKTPFIVDANNVRSVMGIDKTTGLVGNVDFNLIVLEAGKNIGSAVKIIGDQLPMLGNANKEALVFGGENGRILTFGTSTYQIDANNIAKIFWDGVDKTWSIVEQQPVDNTSTDEFNPIGELPQSQKGVALHTFNKIQDGSKMLQNGFDYPIILTGRYPNSTPNNGIVGAVLSNSNFITKVYEIPTGSISALELDVLCANSAIFYLAQYKGDYENPTNFIYGQKLSSSQSTSIQSVFSINPDTKFILLCYFANSPLGRVEIKKVIPKGVAKNQGQDYPLKNYPVQTESFQYNMIGLKNGIINAAIKASDFKDNYYQLGRIARKNKLGSSTMPNCICVIKRKREDDSIIKVYNYQGDTGGLPAEIISNLNKLEVNGVQTIVLKDDTYEITLDVDTDSFNEGTLSNFGYPQTDTARVSAFTKFGFDESVYNDYSPTGVTFNSEAYKQLLIGRNEPKRINDKWLVSDGSIGSNGSLYIKYFKIVKGSIDKVRVYGKVFYSSPNYFALYSSESMSTSTFISGLKVSFGSTEVVIDEWCSVDPNAEIIAICTSKDSAHNYDINIIDVKSGGNSITPVPSLNQTTKFDSFDIGYNDLSFEPTEYHVIGLTGQSFGENNFPAISVTLIDIMNNFMGGLKPQYVNENINELSPLKSSIDSTNRGEIPLIAAVHQFSQMYRRFVDKNLKVIANSVCRSSSSIETLSKHCENPAYMTGGINVFTQRNVGFATQIANYVKNVLNTTLSMPFFFHIQGESNYSGNGQGLTAGTDQTRDKNEYKALLLIYKNDNQQLATDKFGQSKKPLMFIVPTGRQWMNRRDQSITQAIIEFAEENEDVFLLNPYYAMPGMLPASDHFSSNGARWHGELTAKTLYKVLIKNEEAPIIYLKKATMFDRNTVLLDFKVPISPLVLDNYTTAPQPDYGFVIYNNNVKLTISTIKVVNGTSVEIKVATTFVTGNIELIYAGSLTKGRGNLRDSDGYRSMLTYTDYTDTEAAPEEYVAKDENGIPLYGKPYPLHNWALNIYKKIEV